MFATTHPQRSMFIAVWLPRKSTIRYSPSRKMIPMGAALFQVVAMTSFMPSRSSPMIRPPSWESSRLSLRGTVPFPTLPEGDVDPCDEDVGGGARVDAPGDAVGVELPEILPPGEDLARPSPHLSCDGFPVLLHDEGVGLGGEKPEEGIDEALPAAAGPVEEVRGLPREGEPGHPPPGDHVVLHRVDHDVKEGEPLLPDGVEGMGVRDIQAVSREYPHLRLGKGPVELEGVLHRGAPDGLHRPRDVDPPEEGDEKDEGPEVGVTPGVGGGEPHRLAENLPDPSAAPRCPLEGRAGEDGGGEEVLEPGALVVVAPVHVPRLRVRGNLEHHGHLGPLNRRHSLARDGKTRAMMARESSRFHCMYSFFDIPICSRVASRRRQGELALQHQAREPKQVYCPSWSGVPRTASFLKSTYSSRERPTFESVGWRGQSFTGRQQKVRARTSPPRQSCLGALYQPNSFAYRVMAASRPARVWLSEWRAREMRSAPWENISMTRSKDCMELFAMIRMGEAFRICRTLA